MKQQDVKETLLPKSAANTRVLLTLKCPSERNWLLSRFSLILYSAE